jgi:hypothetical protein
MDDPELDAVNNLIRTHGKYIAERSQSDSFEICFVTSVCATGALNRGGESGDDVLNRTTNCRQSSLNWPL